MASLLLCALLTPGQMASTVTIRQNQAPLSKALEAVQKQTGIVVVASESLGNPNLSIDLSQQSFWQAIDGIAARVGARANPYTPNGSIQLVPTTNRSAEPVSYNGMFRTGVKRITSTQNFETESRTMALHLEVAWDPRFVPLYLQALPKDFVCQDDNGKDYGKLIEESNWVPVDGSPASGIKLLLSLPFGNLNGARPTRLGSVKGHFLIRGASEMVSFDFGPLSRLEKTKLPLVKRLGETICEIQAIEQTRRRWSITMHVEIPKKGPTLESHQFWFDVNRISLVEKNQQRTTTKSERNSISSRSATITYHFEKPRGNDLSNMSLRYSMPRSLIEVPVPFDLKDIVLP